MLSNKLLSSLEVSASINRYAHVYVRFNIQVYYFAHELFLLHTSAIFYQDIFMHTIICDVYLQEEGNRT